MFLTFQDNVLNVWELTHLLVKDDTVLQTGFTGPRHLDQIGECEDSEALIIYLLYNEGNPAVRAYLLLNVATEWP